MTDDSTRVVFHLDPDPLLVGVLRNAVQFQGLQAGFDSEACAEFAKALEDLCHAIISQPAEVGKRLDVTLDTFPDRIEICVNHPGQIAPAVGLDSLAFSESTKGAAGRFKGLELLSRVDRVLFSAEEGVARTTLVKFLHPTR